MSINEKWTEAKKVFDERKGTIQCISQLYLDRPLFSIMCTYWDDGICGILIRFRNPVLETGIGSRQYKGFITKESHSKEKPGCVEIDIVESSPEYHDIFSLFCESLLLKIKDKTGLNSVCYEIWEHIQHWKSYIEETSEKILTMDELKGLYGELIFLRNRLIPALGVEKAIKSWRGPQKKAQDFVFDDIAAEVKTSSDAGETSITISNIKQLDNTGFRCLFIYYIRVIETGSGNENINQIVNSIIDLMFEYPETREKFITELGRLHYIPGSKINEKYEPYGFVPQSESFFEVTDDFPCLTRVKYLKGLNWIEDVSYSLKLSYLKDYRITPDEFENIINGN